MTLCTCSILLLNYAAARRRSARMKFTHSSQQFLTKLAELTLKLIEEIVMTLLNQHEKVVLLSRQVPSINKIDVLKNLCWMNGGRARELHEHAMHAQGAAYTVHQILVCRHTFTMLLHVLVSLTFLEQRFQGTRPNHT